MLTAETSSSPFEGAAVEGLDVLELVDEAEAAGVELVVGQGVEHEGVVGVGAVPDPDRAAGVGRCSLSGVRRSALSGVRDRLEAGRETGLRRSVAERSVRVGRREAGLRASAVDHRRLGVPRPIGLTARPRPLFRGEAWRPVTSAELAGRAAGRPRRLASTRRRAEHLGGVERVDRRVRPRPPASSSLNG